MVEPSSMKTIRCVVLGVAALASPLLVSGSSSSQPNFVILFADNLGYADIALFGGTPKTPNVDRIGHEGMKFTNWNSIAHLCSASRASLLTGKYPVRTGIYPGVFKPDAVYGMLPQETTLAEYLRDEGYATSIVGKWHLGQNPDFLPLNQGFDEWLGLPYHASGGSLDNRICHFDTTETAWLPLYDGNQIIQQPVKLQNLAHAYATRSKEFMARNAANQQPFFLYMAFSHVHQLCAPRDYPEQEVCQWNAELGFNATFTDAVQEMDWIAGEILDALDEYGLTNDTVVLFTSDNGPWLSEQRCSGAKGPFKGQWLMDNVPQNCTACPNNYFPKPTNKRPRRCVLPGTSQSVDGVHCGEDTGLGSVWEANLRMPAVVRWPGKVTPGSETNALVSTLDVVPTVLSIIGKKDSVGQEQLDGIDISPILFGVEEMYDHDRVLYLWRDGFKDGPLGGKFGRYDVVALKVGSIKAWIWTKSAHYHDDEEVFHDPPLLFDVLNDPAEAVPLNPEEHRDLIQRIPDLVQKHKESVDWTFPLALFRDARYTPCVNPDTGCRTEQINFMETINKQNK